MCKNTNLITNYQTLKSKKMENEGIMDKKVAIF